MIAFSVSNVGNYVVGKIFGDEDVKINCAAADLGIKDGLDANTPIYYSLGVALLSFVVVSLLDRRPEEGLSPPRPDPPTFTTSHRTFMDI